jgi:hypothetical protein
MQQLRRWRLLKLAVNAMTLELRCKFCDGNALALEHASLRELSALAPRFVCEHTTDSIVAATEMLDVSDFHSRRAAMLWEIGRLFGLHL